MSSETGAMSSGLAIFPPLGGIRGRLQARSVKFKVKSIKFLLKAIFLFVYCTKCCIFVDV